MKWFLTALLFAGFAHASPPVMQTKSMAGFPNTLKGADFFVIEGVTGQKNPPWSLSEANCRAQIAKVICLAEPMGENDDIEKRTCLPGGEKYAHYFEEIYDYVPPALQKMFCSLDRLFIEKQFDGTAYATSNRDDDGNITFAAMGFRKTVLDEGLTLMGWASWKEQLSFGGYTDSYDLKPDLQYIETTSNTQASDLRYFVIVHEFGHFFDFANDLNEFTKCVGEPGSEEEECELVSGSWGALSWKTNHQVLKQFDFPTRSKLCFYWCDGHPMAADDITPTYSGLAGTNFISLYAATNPWDDFADSLAYYMMAQNLSSTYTIRTPDGINYDIMAKLTNPRFASKYEYIKKILNRPDIAYP